MNQQELLAVLEDSWRQLDEAVDGLDETVMVEPGVVETWSITDLLGHVTAWEQVALIHVDRWRSGEAPLDVGGSSVDDYNAAESARRRDWTPAQVREEAAETRQRLRTMLASLADGDWAADVALGDRRGSLGDWVGGAMGGPASPGTHASEHAQHSQAWRAARERSRAE